MRPSFFSKVYSLRIFLGFVALVALLYLATPAKAVAFKCETVWSGPSDSNNIVDCLKNRDRIKDQWRYYVYPGFSALFFVLLLVLFPIIFCFCICNGCCSCCHRCCFPTSHAQHYNAPCCLYLCSFVAILCGAGCAVCIIMGAHTFYSGATASKDAVLDKAVFFYNDTANRIFNYASNGDPNTADISPELQSGVESVYKIANNVTIKVNEADDKYFKYIFDAAVVSYCIGWLPFVLLLFTACFACCRISRGFPACCACVYYFVGLVFALLAIIFLVGAYFAMGLAGECDAQVARRAGVFQWYVVPYYDARYKPSLTSLRAELQRLVSARVVEACASINAHCDATPDFASGRPFFCAVPVQCASAADVAAQSREIPVKDQTFCVPGESDAGVDTACSISYCATHCPNAADASNAEMARLASVEVMQYVGSATNASVAQNLAEPLLNGNVFGDALLWATDRLPDMQEGLYMAGSGYFIAVLVFVLGIVVMLRGRTAWGEFIQLDKSY